MCLGHNQDIQVYKHWSSHVGPWQIQCVAVTWDRLVWVRCAGRV